MRIIVHSIIWSIDTEILADGNAANAVAKMSLFDRLGLLGKVAAEAYAIGTKKWRSGPDKDRLQLMYVLFTAPEYLFAYSDRQHLISEEDKQGLVRSLQVLSGEFPLMIMVPGSIAWKKPMLRSDRSSRFDKFARRMEIDTRAQMHQAPDFVHRSINKMPAGPQKLKEFEEREEAVSHRQRVVQALTKRALTQVQKNIEEDPDRCQLARNTAYAFHGGREIGRYHKRANFHEVFKDESDEGFVVFMPGGDGGNHNDRFQVGDLRFGMEICADHDIGYLGASPGPAPHIQVLLSAKVQFEPTHLAVQPAGYLVHACSDHALSSVYGNGIGESLAVRQVDGETLNSHFLGRLHYHRLAIETHPGSTEDLSVDL